MPKKAETVDAYLDSLAEDRRQAIEAVRAVVLKNLPKGYEEGIQYGMIGYFVPHGLYPAGYHCNPDEPLPFMHIGSQKNHMALYMFCLYTDAEHLEVFVEEWKATGRKLDMGKSCVRFKKIEDVALDVVGRAVKRVPVKKFIASYEAGLGGKEPAQKKAAKRSATKKSGSKKTTKKTTKKTAKNVTKKAVKKKAPRR